VALMYPPYSYEAKELHDAMKVLHFAINQSGHLGLTDLMSLQPAPTAAQQWG
jgi:hypothetical protein